ncbi:MAG TPA: hypothetical protein VFW87_02085 [Pirellulales bacterium]|nr:hypothetical protein [Pirellulales bacterium]
MIAPHSPQPWRFQFGLRSLLGTMLLLCVPFAVWGALLRADPSRQFILVIVCLAMPVMLLFLAGLIAPLVRLARRLRRKAPSDAAADDVNFHTESNEH